MDIRPPRTSSFRHKEPASSALTAFSVPADAPARECSRARREHPVRPSLLHLPEDRRRAREEQIDQQVVHPDVIGALGSAVRPVIRYLILGATPPRTRTEALSHRRTVS
ncbi:hypothetical protein GCM10009548_50110 [Streptomyces malaysiensis subsp. malaysiensis]|nr:hypothetical protein DNK48_01710 [Streptomyces malaysiensis]